MESQGGLYRNSGPGLYEFLMEAELQQYYTGIKGDLKVQSTAQLKYVTEEDLTAIGMSKPEMRRLKKYFQKHFPQNYLSKFKKMLLPKREEPPPGAINVLSIEKQDKPPIKVPNKHMIPADAIIVNKELGIGEFGIVQQGVWSNDGERIQVAIKCLSRERMQNNPIEFLKEAAIMHAIDHEHIVRLYGVVLDTNSLMLVTELAPLRSLLECLKQPSLRVSFPVISLCDFAIQIADGMQYLEAKRLIHRDLAARNILVFSKNKVKISDFGLSRALGVGKDYYQTNFNVNLKLPIAWCAPECISYLKFTSSSDVWAYGVTLWEMFSYGFQPWAALTGHQILEAIDEPNFQRLEQPDCCPKEYYTLMQQCWQHEPAKRPKFSELIELLPDLKPEQVQAVQDNSEIGQLSYRQGDVITVLNKGLNNLLWKGVLSNGKTGLFSPAHTIAYLGSNLPSNKPGEFLRGDGKNAFSSHRRKIRTDMISSPQGDLRHTGHVGLDGAYFGDISFLGGKYPHLPRQIVTPYKPHEDAANNSSQIFYQESLNHENSNRDNTNVNNNKHSSYDSQTKNDNMWSDAASGLTHVDMSHKNDDQSIISMNIDNSGNNDHEYHEISDEENQDSALRFDKPLDFDFGPSLLDEMDQMFRSLGTSSPSSPPGHPTSAEQESSNVKNELREMQSKQSNKKKQATVKPISAADQKTLYSAIAMAQELTARSMTDLEYPPESPVTSASPSRRRKFSFKLPHQHSPKPDRRHFAEEAASIPDIQATLSEEAKEVYNSLVETPTLDNTTDTNPLRMLRSGLPVRPRVRGNKQLSLGLTAPHIDEIVGLSDNNKLSTDFYHVGSSTFPKMGEMSVNNSSVSIFTTQSLERHNSLMNIENSQSQSNIEENPIPLPPRDRSRTLQSKSNLPRHQRKHPLIIPGGGISRTLAKAIATSSAEDQIDGVAPSFNLSNPNVSFSTPMISTTSPMSNAAPNSPDEFERRIDSELSALDSLSIENNCLHPCGIISEDLLENSDLSDDSLRENQSNVNCDAVKNSNYFINSDTPQTLSDRKLSFDKKIENNSDNINIADDKNNSMSINGLVQVSSCSLAAVKSQASSELNYAVNKTTSSLNPFDSNMTENESNVEKTSEFKSNTTGNVSKIQTTDDRRARVSDLCRQSDHVSCEDLLEFACDRPNVRRTRGPHNGAQSDEVRIMLKVLQDQSTPESCVRALDVANWDILAAIKLERLQALLKKENKYLPLEECKIMLNQSDGDIVKAAAAIKNTDDSTAV
ncbi:activated Cdc42 kinase-like isoform X4 [Microplitis mediator]|uniref:activated Cdc42 kinase-like isoform X4 n=1 Tax=Microplitis mediator TaxID=375433 RepID=UPI0025563597|nr:activated Cdc42 kinase-like isoform X4 [Microplitis mediator]